MFSPQTQATQRNVIHSDMRSPQIKKESERTPIQKEENIQIQIVQE